MELGLPVEMIFYSYHDENSLKNLCMGLKFTRALCHLQVLYSKSRTCHTQTDRQDARETDTRQIDLYASLRVTQ